MYKKYLVLWALALAVVIGLYGCESSETNPIYDEAQWVEMGWEAVDAANDFDDYDLAHTYFGNALKIDATYAPAHNGIGWTYIYQHDMGAAFSSFQNGFLYAGGLPDSDAHKRMLYIGAMVSLYSLDDFDESVGFGTIYDTMDPNRNFVHPYDASFTAFDALMYLALNYFALGDETNVTHYINELIDIVGGDPFVFTTWAACSAKIDELFGMDPS